jgi:hypothetical protein
VFVHILRIEKRVAAPPQPGDEIDERNLARVGAHREHALAEKRPADGNAVNASCQHAPVPGLDAMRMALFVERSIKRNDVVVDPGRVAHIGAVADDALEIGIESNAVGFFVDGAGEPLGHMQPVDRQDAAELRVVPGDVGGPPVCSHREYSRAISVEQQFGRHFTHDDLTAA